MGFTVPWFGSLWLIHRDFLGFDAWKYHITPVMDLQFISTIAMEVVITVNRIENSTTRIGRIKPIALALALKQCFYDTTVILPRYPYLMLTTVAV